MIPRATGSMPLIGRLGLASEALAGPADSEGLRLGHRGRRDSGVSYSVIMIFKELSNSKTLFHKSLKIVERFSQLDSEIRVH